MAFLNPDPAEPNSLKRTLTPKGQVHFQSHMTSLKAELGISLFEIAQERRAIERTFILGAMALNKNKSEERDERTDKSKF